MRLMDYSIGRSENGQRKTNSSNTRPGSPTPSSTSADGDSRVSSNSFKKSGGEDSRRSGPSSPRRNKDTYASHSSAHRALNALTCILCRGPHKWFECKHKGEIDKLQKRLSAMKATVEPQEEEEADEDASDDGSPKRMGAIRLLYSMGKQPSTSKRAPAKLMYVDLQVNGRKARALIDTGASHNFVTQKEATRLGLKISPTVGNLKLVNSKAKPIAGEAKEVKTKLGEWGGKVDFTMVSMDDIDLVLGLDFMLASKTTVMPHLGSLLIEVGPTCLMRTS